MLQYVFNFFLTFFFNRIAHVFESPNFVDESCREQVISTNTKTRHIIMEKDILIQNLKEKLGNDTASVISDRTFDGISSLYLDSFKEDDKVNDDTYKPVLAVLKEFAGQKRYDEKAFVEKYKADYEKQHEKEVGDKITLAVAKAIEDYKKEHPEKKEEPKKEEPKKDEKDLDTKIAEAIAKAIGGLTSEEGAIGKLTGTVNSFINTYNEREKSAKESDVRQQLWDYLKERGANKDFVIKTTIRDIQIGDNPNIAELKILAERMYEKNYKECEGEGAPAFGGKGNGGAGGSGDTSFVKERIEALKKEAEESAGYQAELEKTFQ